MFDAKFGKKCIMMQFLGMEKEKKRLSTQRRRGRGERFEEESERQKAEHVSADWEKHDIKRGVQGGWAEATG
jgi:hypothetical protein